MDKIKISELENSKNKFIHLDIEDSLLEPKADIKASLDVTSLGEFVSIKGNISGTVKLICDLCLKEYDYELDFDIDEMFAKGSVFDDEKQEVEIKEGQFVTDLNGEKEIDIYDLLYQSVILNLPNKTVCGINCNGRAFLHEEEMLDPRMEVFKNIKIHPKNE